jgi:hypothetical protein
MENRHRELKEGLRIATNLGERDGEGAERKASGSDKRSKAT